MDKPNRSSGYRISYCPCILVRNDWHNNKSPITVSQKTYLAYIRLQTKLLPTSELRSLLSARICTSHVTDDHIFSFLRAIAECANTVNHFGIDKATSYLVQHDIFKADAAHENKARNVVYIAISWICLLYTPAKLHSPYRLQMDENHLANLHMTTQEIEASKHPICELIQQFGPLLPVKSLTNEEGPLVASDTLSAADALYVSMLNAKTLVQIGNINIKWVNNISSHLAFDAVNSSLAVFALPSYCHLYRLDNLTLSNIVDDYYDQYSKPEKFTVQGYLQEVRLSYRLLFGDNKRAHRVYTEIVDGVIPSIGLRDPILDELCQCTSSPSRSTNSYSVSTNFPILGARLMELQKYIQRQNSGSLVMLWRDRRDMLRWYTFWLVTLVGGFTILLALAGLGLAAGQLYYAIPRTQGEER